MKYLIIAVSICLFLSLTSCEKTSESTLNGLWQVSTLVLNNTELKPENTQRTVTLLLDSSKDQTFLSLSANSCTGKFTTDSNNSVNISYLSCTEICCDSDYDIKVRETLNNVKYYDLKVTEVTFFIDKANFIVANKVLPE